MITVLVLASSPLDQGQLHLGKESKVISHTRESATNRDQYRVITCMATTPDDLRRYLLEHSPSVVHFCGHGTAETGLCFEDSEGNTKLVSGESLSKLFHLVNDDVKCVVLNACYSDFQAKAISEHIDFVVGMRGAVSDNAALKFAEGFYEALWAGQSFDRAFKFGCSAIDTAGLPSDEVPIILRSPRLGGLQLPYDEKAQRIESFLLRYINTPIVGRAELTVEGESISETILQYYSGLFPQKWNSVTVMGFDKIENDSFAVTALIRSPEERFEQVYYLKMSGNTPLVHWKATVGYWEIPAPTLLALSSSKPVIARVIAKIDDYFNFGYGPEQHISIALQDLERNHIAGFLSRSQEQFEEIISLLKDGQAHRISLEIQPGMPGRRLAEITKLISTSWIFSDPQ